MIDLNNELYIPLNLYQLKIIFVFQNELKLVHIEISLGKKNDIEMLNLQYKIRFQFYEKIAKLIKQIKFDVYLIEKGINLNYCIEGFTF